MSEWGQIRTFVFFLYTTKNKKDTVREGQWERVNGVYVERLDMLERAEFGYWGVIRAVG